MAEKDKDQLNPKYLDKRVVERYIKRGVVDEKELARHLKALPDGAEKAEKVETEVAPDADIGPAR